MLKSERLEISLNCLNVYVSNKTCELERHWFSLFRRIKNVVSTWLIISLILQNSSNKRPDDPFGEKVHIGIAEIKKAQIDGMTGLPCVYS